MGVGVLRALWEALQMSVLVVFTLLWSPTKDFPDAPPWAIQLIVAFGISAGYFLLRTFLFPRARLSLRWHRATDERELREVDALISHRTKHGQPLSIDVKFEHAWGLGWVFLHLAVRRGLWVKVHAPHSRLALVPSDEREIDTDGPSVKAEPGCAVMIKLPRPVAGVDDAWNEASVRPRGRGDGKQRANKIKHTAVVDGRFGGFLGWWIKIDSKTTRIVERWS